MPDDATDAAARGEKPGRGGATSLVLISVALVLATAFLVLENLAGEPDEPARRPTPVASTEPAPTLELDGSTAIAVSGVLVDESGTPLGREFVSLHAVLRRDEPADPAALGSRLAAWMNAERIDKVKATCMTDAEGRFGFLLPCGGALHITARPDGRPIVEAAIGAHETDVRGIRVTAPPPGDGGAVRVLRTGVPLDAGVQVDVLSYTADGLRRRLGTAEVTDGGVLRIRAAALGQTIELQMASAQGRDAWLLTWHGQRSVDLDDSPRVQARSRDPARQIRATDAR